MADIVRIYTKQLSELVDKLRERVSNAETQLKGVRAENQRLRQSKVTPRYFSPEKTHLNKPYWLLPGSLLVFSEFPIFTLSKLPPSAAGEEDNIYSMYTHQVTL